jgi:hypothetical protein
MDSSNTLSGTLVTTTSPPPHLTWPKSYYFPPGVHYHYPRLLDASLFCLVCLVCPSSHFSHCRRPCSRLLSSLPSSPEILRFHCPPLRATD